MALVLVVALACASLSTHWAVERRRLRFFIGGLGSLPRDPRELALELGGLFFVRLRRLDDDPPYLFSALSPLGATPSSVIHHGGCCSGISRLYILCLSVLETYSHQITVYHVAGSAQHCLVEVRLPDGPLIVDPLYGLQYTDETGGPIGLEHLQAGQTPRFVPLPHSDRFEYPRTEYYDFDFARSKTANWTKSWYRRAGYRLLVAATRGRIDRLRLPVSLEWPQVLLGLLLSAVVTSVGALAAVLR